MENKAVFTDNEIQRSLLSKNFNFVLDKETGVSLCWGKDINDSPEYDPAFPQQISFKLDDTFNLNQMLKDFNFLANVKIKRTEEIDGKKMEEFLPVTDEIEALTNENLVCLSTLGCIYLIIDESINKLNVNDILTFIRYVESFKPAFHIQMNIDKGFSVSDFLKIKLLSSKIMLRTYCTNINNVLSNIKQLQNNNISCGIQILVNKENVENVLALADKLSYKDLSITLYFVEPYVTTNLFVIIQKKFIDAGFTAIQIATCSYSKFNKRKNNILINTIDCDASRFSIYVENRVIYACPFKTSNGIEIENCNSITDFWHNKKFAKFRKFIIENNYCKTSKK